MPEIFPAFYFDICGSMHHARPFIGTSKRHKERFLEWTERHHLIDLIDSLQNVFRPWGIFLGSEITLHIFYGSGSCYDCVNVGVGKCEAHRKIGNVHMKLVAQLI